MKKQKYQPTSILSATDVFFVINGDMIPENGEDSYAFSINENAAMLSVFDGCGGIGSRKYEIYNNKTGAYLASHYCASLMYDWFKGIDASGRVLKDRDVESECENLKASFTGYLSQLNSAANTTTIKGSLTRDFPTTISTIIFSGNESDIKATYLWAGDSRGYLLDDNGLVQVTRDDIYGDADAMENLTDDGRLANLICADGKYVLNTRTVNCPKQAIYITATDGCFGYFSTPMEFENMIVSTLTESENINQWKAKLKAYILNYTGDDYTMGIAAIGYRSFKNLKRHFMIRKDNLQSQYISALGKSEDAKKRLWESYKDNYYRSV